MNESQQTGSEVHLLAPARYAGESYGNYVARRKAGNAAVRRLLRGEFCHVSSRIVQLPPVGVDAGVEVDVYSGVFRDVADSTRLDANGRCFRIGRTRGETFKYPEGRAEHKQAVRQQRKERKRGK